ncbi:uncharacterized protein [Panulirus ornatus]
MWSQNMNPGRGAGAVFLLLVVVVTRTKGVQISLDLSQLTKPQHLQAMEELTVSTFLAVPTTTLFTLFMNPPAMKGMSHLLNGSVDTLEFGQQQQMQKEQQERQQQERPQQQHQKTGKSLFSNNEAAELPAHLAGKDSDLEARPTGVEGLDMGDHLLDGKDTNLEAHVLSAGKSKLGTNRTDVEDSYLGAHLSHVENSDLRAHSPGVEDFDLASAHLPGEEESKLGVHMTVVEDSHVGAHVMGVNDSDPGVNQTHGENYKLKTSQVEDLGTHLEDVEDSDTEAHPLDVEGPSLRDHLSGLEDSDLGAHEVNVADSNLRDPLSGVNSSHTGSHPVGVKDLGAHLMAVVASDSQAHPSGVKDFDLKDHEMGVKDLDLQTRIPDEDGTDFGADVAGIENTELWACMAGLSKENTDMVRAMVSGELSGVLLKLVPTDEDFQETLQLLHSLRTCRWYPSSPVPQPKVEALKVGESMPKEVEQRLKVLTSGEEVEAGRAAAHRTASPMRVDLQQLKQMLGSVFSITRNHETAPLDKLVATLYISKKFNSFGLMVVNHVFSAAEYSLWFDKHLQGTNVIGVLAGSNWGTAADEPLVLGAHLDTVSGTPGLDDDGSGLAALVEAARVLSSSGCIFTHTIFFVAFDLEEIGTQGSLVFVKDYLTSAIMDKFGIRQVTGAFILDCVSNWDPQPGTQDFPEHWSNLLPDAGHSLSQHNYTGDFAAIIYRTQVDAHLTHRFAQYYGDLDQPQYRLELLGLKALGAEMPDMSTLKTHFDFLRSDHLRFWYVNDTRSFNTIPAVLLTDTGPYRGMMRQCYHGDCDGPLPQGNNTLGLLVKVTQALVWTMADLAQGRCGPRGTVSTPTLFTLLHPSH